MTTRASALLVCRRVVPSVGNYFWQFCHKTCKSISNKIIALRCPRDFVSHWYRCWRFYRRRRKHKHKKEDWIRFGACELIHLQREWKSPAWRNTSSITWFVSKQIYFSCEKKERWRIWANNSMGKRKKETPQALWVGQRKQPERK